MKNITMKHIHSRILVIFINHIKNTLELYLFINSKIEKIRWKIKNKLKMKKIKMKMN